MMYVTYVQGVYHTGRDRVPYTSRMTHSGTALQFDGIYMIISPDIHHRTFHVRVPYLGTVSSTVRVVPTVVQFSLGFSYISEISHDRRLVARIRWRRAPPERPRRRARERCVMGVPSMAILPYLPIAMISSRSSQRTV